MRPYEDYKLPLREAARQSFLPIETIAASGFVETVGDEDVIGYYNLIALQNEFYAAEQAQALERFKRSMRGELRALERRTGERFYE